MFNRATFNGHVAFGCCDVRSCYVITTRERATRNVRCTFNRTMSWNTNDKLRDRTLLAGTAAIGLYRDVWIAAITWSRTSLETQTAVMCVCFQRRKCKWRSLRANPLRSIRRWYVRVASLTLDCNGVYAIKAYVMKHERQTPTGQFWLSLQPSWGRVPQV